MKPLVTTLIPTYRRPDRLRRAIWSALQQDYEEVLVCVFDNASGDETAEVVSRIQASDGRVQYHRHDSNLGAVRNFNFALSRVETPYFSILSDDDMLLPGFYSRAVGALEKQPEAGFFGARSVVFNESQNAVHLSPACWPAGHEGFHAAGLSSVLSMIKHHFCWTGVMWRRDVVESVGKVDIYGSDDNYLVRAAARTGFVVSNENVALSFHHEDRFSFDRPSSPRDGQSKYLEWLIARSAQLECDLYAEFSLNPEERIEAIEALERRTQDELVRWLFQHSIPNNRRKEMRTVRRALSNTNPSPWHRAAVEAVGIVCERVPGAAALASTGVGRARQVAIARRRRKVTGSELDLQIRRYVAESDLAASVSTPIAKRRAA